MHELQEDLRKVSLRIPSFFVALDFNVIRARYWSRAIPPPRTRCEQGGVTEKEAHKTYQYRCWTKRGKEVHGVFLKSHGAGVALEVHPLFWRGSHGLKLHATAMTLSNE